MHTRPSFSIAAKSIRTAVLLLAAVILPITASASDALTTVAGDVAGASKLRSLFSRSSSDTAASTGSSSRLSRSILGLPFGILRSVVTGVSKVASSAVTKHITKN